MKLSRKDYNALAERVTLITDKNIRRLMVVLLLPVLKDSNPRFNPTRFVTACGLDPATFSL